MHHINKIPKERRKIRPNVEATIMEFKNKTKAGKLKGRVIFKTKLFAFAMGVSINFGRIYRLIMSGNEKFGGVLANFKIFIVQILNLYELEKRGLFIPDSFIELYIFCIWYNLKKRRSPIICVTLIKPEKQSGLAL